MHRRLQDDPAYIADTRKWLEESDEIKKLGKGSDGWVALWKNRTTGRAVAIKAIDRTYAGNMESVIRNLRNEFAVMSKLGIHPNIVQVVGWNGDFYNSPHGLPALFLEGADLGSMATYRHEMSLYLEKFPEVTIWKILADISRAVDWLHNGLKVKYVHGDVKPDNFLVFRPKGVRQFPLLPTFKFADFGRMIEFDPGREVKFMGTPEFGPPIAERNLGTTPATDIWGIGATISELAYSSMPIETDSVFLARYMATKPDFWPNFGPSTLRHDGAAQNFARYYRKPVVRPMNASKPEQFNKHRIRHRRPIEPYSDELQYWYEKLCNIDRTTRVTADLLQKFLIPTAEANVEYHARKWDLEYAQKREERLEINRSAPAGTELLEVPPLYGSPTTDRGGERHLGTQQQEGNRQNPGEEFRGRNSDESSVTTDQLLNELNQDSGEQEEYISMDYRKKPWQV